MTLFEKICRMVGDRRIPAFRMPAFKRFRVGFANRHATSVVVLAIMISAGAVSVGLFFAIRDVNSTTYNWPEPAEYAVTAEGLQTMGRKNPDYPDGTESQTLSIRLADGARISTLRIIDTDLGKTDLARALDIRPATTAVTGMVRILKANNKGSIFSNTAIDVLAEIMILDPRNNQTKTTGAAITNLTISPLFIWILSEWSLNRSNSSRARRNSS